MRVRLELADRKMQLRVTAENDLETIALSLFFKRYEKNEAFLLIEGVEEARLPEPKGGEFKLEYISADEVRLTPLARKPEK